jgi:general secretion pathway protein D
MRLIAILLALLIPMAPWASAPNAKIKTLFVQGKPAYVVVFSNLTNEHDAQSQQKQLQSQVEPNSVQLITEPNHTFSIKAGPLTDYELAKRLVQNTPVPTETTPAQLPSSNSPDAPPPDAPTDEKLWNLSNADIRAVIAEVSRATGKNFVIDPRVQGKISIVSTTPLNNQALYQVFLSVLQISGYSAIPGDGIIKIVPNMDAKTLSDTENPHLKIPPRGEEILTSVIPVHYVPADQLVPVLRPLMPQWSFISAYTPANMLILSGTANNIRQISEIIHQVDSSSSHDIDVVQLHHALAMDVVNTLKELVKSTTTSGASQSAPTLAVDDRNNSILISGSRTARLRLRMIIAKLDKPISSSTSNHTQVIYLHYLRAEDLTPILAGVAQANFSGTVGTTIGTMTQPTLDSTNPLSSIVGDNPYSAPSQQKPAPQPSTPAVTNSSATPNTSNASGQTEGSTKPNVQIIAEPNTNSIIINGPASIIRIMKSVVSQLDIRPAPAD